MNSRNQVRPAQSALNGAIALNLGLLLGLLIPDAPAPEAMFV